MRYGSVCSGIEAATAAWHPLGWKPAFFSEIDKFPRAVLRHHYPDVPCHGDFTTIKEDDYGAIDLLVGGTPCQDFSVAGLRKGITGERGNLTLEFIRLVKRKKPRWVVWENVPGILSSDGGRAFGAFLGGLGQCGYGYAYRVLDAQYFGVPQRRRRVFVIGYLGDWRRAAAVLFEPEGLRGDITPSREAREGVTHDVAPSIRASGVGSERCGDTRGQDAVIACAPTLRAGGNRTGGDRPPGTDVDTSVALIITSSSGSVPRCLNAGGMGRQDFETETLITHALRGEGFDASEDGTGRGTPLITIPILEAGARSNKTIPINTQLGLRGPDTSNTLKEGIGIGEEGDPMFTLQAAHQHAVAFVQNGRDEVRLMGGDGGITGALAAEPGAKQQCYVTSPSMAVRRLTPLECERLQGFPDNYTKITDKTADGPRYKALGNSMAVVVMEWLGKRIDMVESLINGGLS